MKIAIIGAGYVGLTTGVTLAYTGHEVALLEADPDKVAMLRQGRFPIYEPHLEDLAALARPRLSFTGRPPEALDGAAVVFIAVGTPPQSDGNPDLSFLQSAARTIGRRLNGDFTVVVNKSTVPIGSGNWVECLVREAYAAEHGRKANGNIAVASNPEFLREGSALHDSLYPDRLVIGCDDRRAMERLHNLYRPVVEQTFPAPTFLPRPDGLAAVPLITTELASSELIKYAANAFLSVKVSFINEIAQLAERVGADITQIGRGIGLDSRIGARFLQAGIGWGGSCFGKDTAALVATARDYGLNMPIVQAAREINYRQRDRVVDKLLAELKILKGRTIGLLGLAFKPHTDDCRDSPALDIAKRLLERGATVRAHDPVVDAASLARQAPGLALPVVDRVECAAQEADALVLVTDWPDYRDLDWEALASSMRIPLFLDGRNFLDRARMEAAGFRFLGMGR